MSKASGLYVLIEWVTEEITTLDVYSIKTIADKDLACKIASSRDFSPYIGLETNVLWKKKTYPAKLLAFGSADEVEMKRKEVAAQVAVTKIMPAKKSRDPAINKQNQNLLDEINDIEASRGVSVIGEETERATTDSQLEAIETTKREQKLLKRIEKLKRKNQALKEENEKLQKLAELGSLVTKMKKIVKKSKDGQSCQPEKEIEAEEMVDIGNNVMIKRSDLTTAEFSSSGNPKVFARNLLLCLFSEHELINSSISGKQSNAYKHIAAKKRLDPVKINSILNFVKCKYTGISVDKIKRSIQDKIKEMTNVNKRKIGNAITENNLIEEENRTVDEVEVDN